MPQQSSVSCLSSYVQQHLRRCLCRNDIQAGMLLHTHLVIQGLLSNVYLENILLDMYGKCGAIDDARRMFDKILLPNLFSWTAIITAYSQSRQFGETLNLFCAMQCTGIIPDRVLFMLVIHACTNLAASHVGRLVHAYVTQNGYETEMSVCKNLVEMYKQFGKIHDAWGAFSRSGGRDVILWSSMISAYVQYAFSTKALDLFSDMLHEGVQANERTFTCVVKACTQLQTVDDAMYVHSMIVENSLDDNQLVANSLIDMYIKCRCLQCACAVFEKMHSRDTISWTMMITGHAKAGFGEDGLSLFMQMDKEGYKASCVTYTGTLNACTSIQSCKWGMYVHDHIVKNVSDMDTTLENSLIDMYIKCGSIKSALCVFNNMVNRHTVTWTLMISGYTGNNGSEEAFQLFRQMQTEGFDSDVIILVSMLDATANMVAFEYGKQLHAQIVASNIHVENLLGSALIDMYTKCQSLDNAVKAFQKLSEPDIVSWTSMLTGYCENDLHEEALSLYEDMDRKNVHANIITFAVVLKVCREIMDVSVGKEIHGRITCLGYESSKYVASNLVNFYAKCGKIEDACSVFNFMQEPDLVTWNALLAGYVKLKMFLDAFALYIKMQCNGLRADSITAAEILQACIGSTTFENGKKIHGCIIEWNFDEDVFVCSNLMAMYAKCGSVNDAHIVFSKLKNPDLVAWNVMLRCCAEQGHCKKTLELFEQMQNHSKITPDIVTFACVLAACSHGGIVENGQHYFKLMTQVFKLTPLPWHCACIVDLLGRAGHLSDAEEFIAKLPIQPDIVVWMSLLGACRNHGDAILGYHAFKNVIRLDVKHVSAYILMSSIYVALGQQEEAAAVINAMEIAGLTCPDGRHQNEHSYELANLSSLLHGPSFKELSDWNFSKLVLAVARKIKTVDLVEPIKWF